MICVRSGEVEESVDHCRLAIEWRVGLVGLVGARLGEQVQNVVDFQRRTGSAHRCGLALPAPSLPRPALPCCHRCGCFGGGSGGGGDGLCVEHHDVARGGLEAMQVALRVSQRLQPHVVREGLARPRVVRDVERARPPVADGAHQVLSTVALRQRPVEQVEGLAEHLLLVGVLAKAHPRGRREHDLEGRRRRGDDLHVLVGRRLHARLCVRCGRQARAKLGRETRGGEALDRRAGRLRVGSLVDWRRAREAHVVEQPRAPRTLQRNAVDLAAAPTAHCPLLDGGVLQPRPPRPAAGGRRRPVARIHLIQQRLPGRARLPHQRETTVALLAQLPEQLAAHVIWQAVHVDVAERADACRVEERRPARQQQARGARAAQRRHERLQHGEPPSHVRHQCERGAVQTRRAVAVHRGARRCDRRAAMQLRLLRLLRVRPLQARQPRHRA
mmetsp:Transcript_37289/g.120453  ORF Transcript_37289/g.120453 Transcript_37289/m.120453 type:complete len:443 (+) Transcript_37289:489-1817(+)